jgi:hypothetical protein
MGHPLLQAIAWFGQAAARPYTREARPLAERARETLSAYIEPLDDAARSRFCALPERKRVLDGNFVGFGLKRTPTPGEGPQGRAFWKFM